jgi:hypothetical protein
MSVKDTKTLRGLKQRMDELGLTVVSLTLGGGGHYKIKVRKGDRLRTIICPTKLGDVRAEKNWVAQLRRTFA